MFSVKNIKGQGWLAQSNSWRTAAYYVSTGQTDFIQLALFGGAIAVQAISPIATQFSVAWSVRLSSVTFLHPSCLNRVTNFDAILACAIIGVQGKVKFYWLNTQTKHKICHLANRNEQFRFLPNQFGPCCYYLHRAIATVSCLSLRLHKSRPTSLQCQCLPLQMCPIIQQEEVELIKYYGVLCQRNFFAV